MLIPLYCEAGTSCRDEKTMLAIIMASALSLFGLYSGKLKSFKNIWAIMLCGYLLISALCAPKANLLLFSLPIGALWVWKNIYYAFVMLGMLALISNKILTDFDIKLFLEIMIWMALISAIYVIFQYFGIDQFFVRTQAVNLEGHMGATFGHPTLVSPFIAMIIPIAIYRRKFIQAIVMAVAIVMTKSQVAIGAAVVGVLFYYSTQGSVKLILSILTASILSFILIYGYFNSGTIQNFVEDNTRFQNWKQIYSDVVNPIDKEGIHKYSFTGFGPGTFYFRYHVEHNNNYLQAHNEYLEFLYDTGFIGLGLLLCAIGYMVKINYKISNIWHNRASKYKMALLSSFICIAVAAGGTFVWHIGAYTFYTIVICGLLHNKTKEKQYVL